MLPKVATHILHSTATRAAAAVQNQTHTLRNVLQLHPSGPSSGSGSNWGNGPGPGGSKHNAGSRFYTGYNGAARAVTQATVITSQDGGYVQDDVEEPPARRPLVKTTPKRSRLRSSSVTAPLASPRDREKERNEKLSVLKTVQLQARSLHVLTANNAQTSEHDTSALLVEELESVPRPHITRRNSTSSSLASPPSSEIPLPSSPVLSVRRNSLSAHSDASVQFQDLPPPPPSPVPESSTSPPAPLEVKRFDFSAAQGRPPPSDLAIKLQETTDPLAAADLIRELMGLENLNIRDYNIALGALLRTRTEGEPIQLILQIYNLMLERSVMPNIRTYQNLIVALTTRDFEVSRMITSLQARVKRRELTGRFEVSKHSSDEKRIEAFESENNYSSAMALFEAVIGIAGNSHLESTTYKALIRSSALHSNVEGAIHVFAHLERRRDVIPDSDIFRYLIQAFSNAGDIKGAEATFQGFSTASHDGRIYWHEEGVESYRRLHLQLWNQMIEAYFRVDMPEKAIELVDQMLASPAGAEFGLKDVPTPASSTFTTVLCGFVQMGDVPTALSWFDRLYSQGKVAQTPFDSLGGEPAKPDKVAWTLMLDALALNGMVDDLNRLFSTLVNNRDTENKPMRLYRHIVYSANMDHLATMDRDAAVKALNFLAAKTLISDGRWDYDKRQMVQKLCEEFIARGCFKEAFAILNDFTRAQMELLENGTVGPEGAGVVNELQNIVLAINNQVYAVAAQGTYELPHSFALELAHLTTNLGLRVSGEHAPYLMHAYGLAKNKNRLSDGVSPEIWRILLACAVHLEVAALNGTTSDYPTIPDYAFAGVMSLLNDMAQDGITFDPETFNADLRTSVVKVISSQYDAEFCKNFFANLGPSYEQVYADFAELQYSSLQEALERPPVDPLQDQSQTMTKNYGPLEQHSTLSKDIEVILRDRSYSQQVIAHKSYGVFQKGLENMKIPYVSTLSRMIQVHGRLNELDRVRELYAVAQSTVANLSKRMAEDRRIDLWLSIEDAMIIALAHAGDIESAHVHRRRILDFGNAPSADAYGALILHVKDTTDDATNSLMLFNESQRLGVKPNLYLYNNIISKLSKARKIDNALELFQQMRANEIVPSSITYGAVIGACARVADITSAEALFAEMVNQGNFKPRVPPFNTMMQLYTTTKPNRERALFFYNELLRVGVAPTAHTYKLLLDAYGSVEPVDIASMETVFQQLVTDTRVQLQGNHFASLINAYGCVLKDLDRAIAIFDSIPSYDGVEADAVVYEAMLNTLVALRRVDLVPTFMSKMIAANVHMTAYVANFLIKGYANMGDLDQARAIFESMADPATGMAAPNNHAPHDPSSSNNVDVMEPVYREPSTWEAMVRAELGAGNRNKANDLLERLKTRQYPEAVYNRISGVMIDHSMIVH